MEQRARLGRMNPPAGELNQSARDGGHASERAHAAWFWSLARSAGCAIRCWVERSRIPPSRCREMAPIGERDVPIPMRDGTILRGDLYRPASGRPPPVLVYRTPYGKQNAAQDYQIHLAAVRRGYVVLLQDVRGRYESDGVFDPYRQEGRDGFDTIEWAARQPWSNGRVGTFGLSYPGAVQWLAAMDAAASRRHGAGDDVLVTASFLLRERRLRSLVAAVDLRQHRARHAPAPRPARHARRSRRRREWREVATQYSSWLPLRELPYLRREAPFYFEWLAHAPEDPWWDWAELRGRYAQVTAAVLNLSGWYDEAYGPEGAVTNFRGLVAARATERDARTNLLIGPWVHGISSTAARRTGDLDFGPQAIIDYDPPCSISSIVTSGASTTFLVGAARSLLRDGRQRMARCAGVATLRPATITAFHLAGANHARRGRLHRAAVVRLAPAQRDRRRSAQPGAGSRTRSSDRTTIRSLAERSDVLTFETGPLAADWLVTGRHRGHPGLLRLSRLRPVGAPAGCLPRWPGHQPDESWQRRTARELPASATAAELLEPGTVYELRLPMLLTSNLFAKDHRIRAQISASFAPHLSRNLQTGESEVTSAESRPAHISIHHGADGASRLLVPVGG